ncbi:MAG: hypothetical protein GXP22_00685 [Gammaproteobacteria bacterium]|nr:hypothetical protein [Gammaproteobacteria bacterium]
MAFLSKRIWSCAIAASLALPATVFATNGYFLIGYGPKSRAMGGAGVAYGTDSLAAAANPAAMIDVKSRVDANAEFFLPPRAVYHSSDTTPVNSKSGSNVFLIPSMGAIYKFNKKMVMGMAGIGAGLGTRFDQSQPGNNFFDFNNKAGTQPTAGVMLMQMQMLPSVAYRVSKKHTIGVSIAMAVQTFRAYGIGDFADWSSAPEYLSNNGNDWSYGGGIRVGWLGKFLKKNRLTLGANWSSRVYMSKFDKYRGLFADQGNFDIPPTLTIGASFKVSRQLTVAMDIQKNFFSQVASVGNPGPIGKFKGRPVDYISTPDCVYTVTDPASPNVGLTMPCTSLRSENKLGGSRGMGFGWSDQTVFKLGFDYKYNKKWNWRAGLNYGKSPVDPDQIMFSLLAPGIVEKHVTFGFTYKATKRMELSMNYMHAFKNTIEGTTFQTNRTPGTNNASASMYQDSVGFGWGYRF